MSKIHPWALIFIWLFLCFIVKEELVPYVFGGGLIVLILISLGFFDKQP